MIQNNSLISDLELIDIGVNLTNNRYHENWQQVVEDASKARVNKLIITGTSPAESVAAWQQTLDYEGRLFSTAGCHPHDAKELNQDGLQMIEELLHKDTVVAVGECGLDFNRNYSPKEAQLSAFEKQLELAVKCQKPLFLHERDAFSTQIGILKNYLPKITGAVAHCFTGNKSQLRSYLDLGLSIGITGWICDKRRGQELFDIVRYIPDDRLMVETDAPFLLPHNIEPKPKSRTNHPKYLPWIIETIARGRNQTVKQVSRITSSNAIRFFNLS